MSTRTPLSLVVLISGSGSNLQAIIDAIESGHLNAEIRAVISNRPDAFGLRRAQKHGIHAIALDHTEYDSRDSFDARLQREIDQFAPELIVLAGYMRILTESLIQHFSPNMLNIHPSLLPDFPGLDTHERALAAAVKVHGASVHFVTAELDGGPVIAQTRLRVDAADTASTLAARLLPLEHRLLVEVVSRIAQGRLELREGIVIADGEALQQPLVL